MKQRYGKIVNMASTATTNGLLPAVERKLIFYFLDSFYLHAQTTAFAIPGSASGCLALGLGAMDGLRAPGRCGRNQRPTQ